MQTAPSLIACTKAGTPCGPQMSIGNESIDSCSFESAAKMVHKTTETSSIGRYEYNIDSTPIILHRVLEKGAQYRRARAWTETTGVCGEYILDKLLCDGCGVSTTLKQQEYGQVAHGNCRHDDDKQQPRDAYGRVVRSSDYAEERRLRTWALRVFEVDGDEVIFLGQDGDDEVVIIVRGYGSGRRLPRERRYRYGEIVEHWEIRMRGEIAGRACAACAGAERVCWFVNAIGGV
ncbi:hypothetical protein K466DRAFT_182541 [Polyporus arcularius HHB13444]|uniref:Uncharacterized protein n=1 Tax=Polyporus arcularius HHB13444 TaxID=1314778 RepID=A0A5C3PXU6_9APHY|nr:hypothetical protein K466DRAFT_182541 [Polyporus arcularius HHB13444]